MFAYKSPAIRRYTIRLAILMSLYLVILIIADRTFRHRDIAGLHAYALASASALPCRRKTLRA